MSLSNVHMKVNEKWPTVGYPSQDEYKFGYSNVSEVGSDKWNELVEECLYGVCCLVYLGSGMVAMNRKQ